MLRDRDAKRAGGAEFATETAIGALGFLAADETRLERFLALSGLGPHNLRRAAADPTFLTSVLDYVAGDERLLVEFAQSIATTPEIVMRARDTLSGPSRDGP